MPASLDERVAVTQQATDQARSTVEELAQLSNIAYEQCRVETAKEMGVRVSVLDAEVEKLRPKAPAAEDEPFPTPEPWLDPVVLADLLDEIVVLIHRHVILEKSSAIAIALYVLLTYCVEVISCCTTLAIESPEKRCGKTTLLDLLMRLVYRPIPAANISPAAVYRMIEAMQPTLLIDEADTFLRANDDIRGILNSGHTRATAVVWRTEEINGEWTVVPFSTWGAKVIAQIGQLYETLRDRSIVVPMRRKLPDEKVERLRKKDYSHIPRKAYTWALENKARIPVLEPEIPEYLNDRQADGWEPLFAIADIAGGEWPVKARSAAKSLSGAESEGDGIRIQLLTDLRVIFQEDTRIGWGSTDMIQKLCERFEDHPWPTYSKGNRITPRQLAALLKPFKIKSKVERSLGLKRGYMTKAFQDLFKRYLPFAVKDTPSPWDPPSVCVTPLQPLHSNGSSDFPSVTTEDYVAHEKAPKPASALGCNTVTDRKGGAEGEHIQNDEINVTEDSWEF